MEQTVWNEMKALAASYLPAWCFETEGEEPAAALLAACGTLLQGSRDRLDGLLDKHEIAFHNIFEPVQEEAEPSVLCASLSAPGEGRFLPEETAFYLGGENGYQNLLLCGAVYVAATRLTAMVLAEGASQKLVELPAPREDGVCVFPLFDSAGEGILARGFALRHPGALRSGAGQHAAIRLNTENALLACFAERCRWTLTGDREHVELEQPHLHNGVLTFSLPPSKEALCLEARAAEGAFPGSPIRESWISVAREFAPPQRVATETGFLAEADFLPFGEDVELFSCCYFSADEILPLGGARAELRFRLSCAVSHHALPAPEQEEPEYRMLMRRLPKRPPVVPVSEVCAERVELEYFNGNAWFPLPESAVYSGIFSVREGDALECRQAFAVPMDAASCEVQGEARFWLRWRVTRAPNSGWLPRVCFAPFISGLQLSARLEDAPMELVRPDWAVSGALGEAFVPFPWAEDARTRWWLGLSEKPGGAPFQMLLELEHGEELFPTFFYAREDGSLTPLEVRDGTDGFAHSGLASCAVPEDFFPSMRFGRKLCWLCAVPGRLPTASPVLRRLLVNGVFLRAEQPGAPLTEGESLSSLHDPLLTGRTCGASFGGWGRETREEAVLRFRDRMRHGGCAVSTADMETLLTDSFRDVVRVCCLPVEGGLELAVLMRDCENHAYAYARRRESLRALAEKHSCAASLRLSIKLREPVFQPVCVDAWFALPEGEDPFEAERAVQNALARFLHPVQGGFEGTGWLIGTLPNIAQLETCLRAALPQAFLLSLLASGLCADGSVKDLRELREPFQVPVSGIHQIRLKQRG